MCRVWYRLIFTPPPRRGQHMVLIDEHKRRTLQLYGNTIQQTFMFYQPDTWIPMRWTLWRVFQVFTCFWGSCLSGSLIIIHVMVSRWRERRRGRKRHWLTLQVHFKVYSDALRWNLRCKLKHFVWERGRGGRQHRGTIIPNGKSRSRNSLTDSLHRRFEQSQSPSEKCQISVAVAVESKYKQVMPLLIGKSIKRDKYVSVICILSPNTQAMPPQNMKSSRFEFIKDCFTRWRVPLAHSRRNGREMRRNHASVSSQQGK